MQAKVWRESPPHSAVQQRADVLPWPQGPAEWPADKVELKLINMRWNVIKEKVLPGCTQSRWSATPRNL